MKDMRRWPSFCQVLPIPDYFPSLMLELGRPHLEIDLTIRPEYSLRILVRIGRMSEYITGIGKTAHLKKTSIV